MEPEEKTPPKKYPAPQALRGNIVIRCRRCKKSMQSRELYMCLNDCYRLFDECSCIIAHMRELHTSLILPGPSILTCAAEDCDEKFQGESAYMAHLNCAHSLRRCYCQDCLETLMTDDRSKDAYEEKPKKRGKVKETVAAVAAPPVAVVADSQETRDHPPNHEDGVKRSAKRKADRISRRTGSLTPRSLFKDGNFQEFVDDHDSAEKIQRTETSPADSGTPAKRKVHDFCDVDQDTEDVFQEERTIVCTEDSSGPDGTDSVMERSDTNPVAGHLAAEFLIRNQAALVAGSPGSVKESSGTAPVAGQSLLKDLLRVDTSLNQHEVVAQRSDNASSLSAALSATDLIQRARNEAIRRTPSTSPVSRRAQSQLPERSPTPVPSPGPGEGAINVPNLSPVEVIGYRAAEFFILFDDDLVSLGPIPAPLSPEGATELIEHFLRQTAGENGSRDKEQELERRTPDTRPASRASLLKNMLVSPDTTPKTSRSPVDYSRRAQSPVLKRTIGSDNGSDICLYLSPRSSQETDRVSPDSSNQDQGQARRSTTATNPQRDTSILMKYLVGADSTTGPAQSSPASNRPESPSLRRELADSSGRQTYVARPFGVVHNFSALQDGQNLENNNNNNHDHSNFSQMTAEPDRVSQGRAQGKHKISPDTLKRRRLNPISMGREAESWASYTSRENARIKNEQRKVSEYVMNTAKSITCATFTRAHSESSKENVPPINYRELAKKLKDLQTSLADTPEASDRDSPEEATETLQNREVEIQDQAINLSPKMSVEPSLPPQLKGKSKVLQEVGGRPVGEKTILPVRSYLNEDDQELNRKLSRLYKTRQSFNDNQAQVGNNNRGVSMRISMSPGERQLRSLGEEEPLQDDSVTTNISHDFDTAVVDYSAEGTHTAARLGDFSNANLPIANKAHKNKITMEAVKEALVACSKLSSKITRHERVAIELSPKTREKIIDLARNISISEEDIKMSRLNHERLGLKKFRTMLTNAFDLTGPGEFSKENELQGFEAYEFFDVDDVLDSTDAACALGEKNQASAEDSREEETRKTSGRESEIFKYLTRDDSVQKNIPQTSDARSGETRERWSFEQPIDRLETASTSDYWPDDEPAEKIFVGESIKEKRVKWMLNVNKSETSVDEDDSQTTQTADEKSDESTDTLDDKGEQAYDS